MRSLAPLRLIAVEEIALLKEFRTRLIADVVTGKLDVREAASKLPHEPAEKDAGRLDDKTEAEGEGPLDDEPQPEEAEA